MAKAGRRTGRPVGRAPGAGRGTTASVPVPRERFLSLPPERARREWDRLSGTPQRDLFRQLRNRFLARHAAPLGWSADVGSGPGRFTRFLGGDPDRRVLVDLSLEMLREARRRARGSGTSRGTPHLLRGDGLRPPIRAGALSLAALLGNPLGFQGEQAAALLARTAELVGESGTLVLESAPGPGERSVHLSRLPDGALLRFLRAPRSWAAGRVLAAGFRPVPGRAREHGTFRRIPLDEIEERLQSAGFEIREVLSVAPCLGADAERLGPVRADPHAWSGLLALEEAMGVVPERWPRSAALLVAAARVGGSGRGGPAPRRGTAQLSNPTDPVFS